MKPTRTQANHFTIPAGMDNTFQSIKPNDEKTTFRRIELYQASAYTAAVVGSAVSNVGLTDNAGSLKVGLDADGPRVPLDQLDATAPPLVYVVPDSLPEMKLKDVWIYGAAGDGVFFRFFTAHVV